MRKTTIWQTTRKALTVTALATMVTGGALLTAGTASAATTLANACSGTVNGGMGDTVAITGSSVKELVRAGAKEAGTLALYDVAANDIAKVNRIDIGTVPQAAGGTVEAKAIGAAVRQAVKETKSWGLGFNPEKTLNSIEHKVTGSCGLTTVATNYVAPTLPAPGTTAPQQGGTGGAANGAPSTTNLLPGGSNGTGYAPPRDYGNLPVAQPGVAVAPGVRYPANSPLPGEGAPQYGTDGQAGPNPDVRNAGNAEALATDGMPGGDVQLPMLLAVLVLAGVTAALVRTWVLRRVS
ncbi:hypothetical protein GCM10027598_03290 [Amycolatopsis oliviviridis]|uniref:Uncharacterized protein n=1 Tax=Amycolatopsis oliviviridis TaxID=1471590 RepID=A0ABQ3LMJ9_9PSEU|nr:hypothetical protein [Amycolatopsis oliviviridis]GHH18799.1 hypothetical protein GCM10017790_36680 [Amycolatopsis oliviviridis]